MIRKEILSLSAVLLLIGLSAPTSAQVDNYREIEYPPLAEFEIPKPEIFELDNGLQVFLMEDDELPLIEVIARIRTGSVYESAEKTGLAGITGSVQRTGGTRSMSGDEIDDFLEARAASVETSISNAVGFASMDCLKENFDEVFGVFLEVLRHPRFSEDKIEIAKVQANTGIARRNDNVLGITAREFSRLVYGYGSPLARMQEYATIGAISREDLLAWHGKYYHPNNMLLGVVGDFDSVEMKGKIGEAFRDWPRGPVFDEPPVGYRQELTAGVYFIEKTDVTQANISMGHLGITIDNPDYFAVQVMNEVLGGGFASRLFSRIRSEKGLAYSVRGSVGASFLYPGVAGFGLQTKSETMGEAVDALFAEVRGMISEPATAEELQRAKDSILNSFIFNYASKGQVLGQQMLYSYYGLPLDFLEKYRQNIEKVSGDDVARVAEKYLHPDAATLLVVGNRAEFDRPVESFGEMKVVDITIPSPPDATSEVADTEESRATGREIFSRVVAALGGEDPASTRAIRTRSTLSVSFQGQSMTLGQEFLLVFPDRVYTVVQTPAGEQVAVVDGDRGFVSAQGQVQDMPAERVEQQLEDLSRDLRYLVRYSGDEDLEAVAAGEEEVDGVSCQVVVVTLGETVTRLWADGAGRVLKQAYQGRHPFTGAPGQFEVLLSDYRQVSGRLVPHKRVSFIDGTEFAATTVERVEIDPEFDEIVFEKPAA
jgi:predicted Zn-dependent peptidase